MQLVYKVKNGQSIEEAVEDIIVRTLGELRKNAFGDDNEDAKSLPWKREQVWSVISKLATRSEVRSLSHFLLLSPVKLTCCHEKIPYSDTLIDFPFKGDDAPLKEMEKAELINIVTDDGELEYDIMGKTDMSLRPRIPCVHTARKASVPLCLRATCRRCEISLLHQLFKH